MSFYAISKLNDPEQIRTFLNTDSAYSAYALADLDPPASAHCDWFAASRTGEIEGLALEDVARIMDCPVGTVKSRIFRAKERLRGHLKDYQQQG